MATEIWEMHRSRGGAFSAEHPTITIAYGVRGTDDETEVDALVATTVADSFNSMTLQDWSREYQGNNFWHVEVHYGGAKPKGVGAHLTFDTTGGTEKIYQTLKTLESAAVDKDGNPTAATDFHGAIGVTDHGVDGIEVPKRKLEFTLDIVATSSKLDPDFAEQLEAATGRVNNGPFRVAYEGQVLNFERGELLFRGCAGGGYRGNGEWSFPCKFEASRTETDLVFGGVPSAVPGGPVAGGIRIGEKPGWAYLWFRYDEVHDADANTLPRRPQAAYVERVLVETDFDALFNRDW